MVNPILNTWSPSMIAAIPITIGDAMIIALLLVIIIRR